MQEQPRRRIMRIDVQMVDAFRTERRRPPDDAMYFITTGQQQLTEVCTVLAGDTRDQRPLAQLPVTICDAQFRLALYQSTRLRTPVLKSVCGRQPSSVSAFLMSAQVACTSAG